MKIHTPIFKRVNSQTCLEIVMKFVSYLFNCWRWPSCKEIGLLLFYKYFKNYSKHDKCFFTCFFFPFAFFDMFCDLLIHCFLSHNPRIFLELIKWFWEYSTNGFLPLVFCAGRCGNDIKMWHPCANATWVDLSRFLNSIVSSNESCPKFSTMFSNSVTNAWLVIIGILGMFTYNT